MLTKDLDFVHTVPCYLVYATSDDKRDIPIATSTLVHYKGQIFFLNAGHTLERAIKEFNLNELYVILPNGCDFTIKLDGPQSKYEDATEAGGLDIGITIVENEEDIKLLNLYNPIILKDDDEFQGEGVSVSLFVGCPVSKSKLYRNHANMNRIMVYTFEVTSGDFSEKVFEEVTLDPTMHIVGHYPKGGIFIQKDEGKTQGRFHPEFSGLSGGPVFRANTEPSQFVPSQFVFIGIGIMHLSRPRYLVALRSRVIMNYIDEHF